MPTTLSAQVSTTNLTISASTWTNLLPQASVTGTGNIVEIHFYVDGLDPSFNQIRILVDGTSGDIYDGTTGDNLIRNVVLSSGSHTVDYQVFSFTGGTASNRALTVINLN